MILKTKLVNASYMLNTRLSYFTDMDVFMQKLNSPTIENNCEYVIPMLTRIDECLNYLESNVIRFVLINCIFILLKISVLFLRYLTKKVKIIFKLYYKY